MLHNFRFKRRTFLMTVFVLLSTCTATMQTAAPQRVANNEYMTGAVLWQQTSGEFRALSYQAYALARMMLDRDLRTRTRRPRAVVVDVDETVLDNSPHQAALIRDGESFSPARWTEWCNRAEAEAVPGAVEFLRYAASRRVRVFYITNRREAERDCTIRNLVRRGFPDASNETVLIRTEATGGSKESRRQQIAARYHIALLVGDNLNDFTNVFERKSVEDRRMEVDRLHAEFGTRFIVIPNTMYGDWESAIYGYDSRLTEAERAARRRNSLR